MLLVATVCARASSSLLTADPQMRPWSLALIHRVMSMRYICIKLFMYYKKLYGVCVFLHFFLLLLLRCWHTPERIKLQALVYNILPSTTTVFSYTIGSRKLSANEQFFVGAQTVVSLLQTTQIKQGVSFITANKVYTSTNKTTIIWIETELFFLLGVNTSHVYVHALALGCFYSHIRTQTFQRVLTASLDSCAEIKSTPSVA